MLRKVFSFQFTVVSLLFFLFTVTCSLSTVYAAEEFGTSYDVLYDVGEDGETLVTEKVTLKNLTSQYYASQFKLIIGATQISDIKASDEGGVMQTHSETKDNSTIIDVKFNQQVAGLNKTLPWTLTFKSKDFTQNLGKVWEIRVPKVTPSQNLQNYSLTIAVPSSFGEPSLINPAPQAKANNGKLFLSFTKDQLLDSGVSANFGDTQLFDFELNYHLENNNLVSILKSIPLPPDTAYQEVIFSKIDPKPLNVTLDQDGNYLAWYRLGRGERLDINLVGSSKLYASSKVKNPFLPEDLKNKYTKSQKYWEKDNPAISSKLKEILGDNSKLSADEKAKLVYKYVVNNLKYDSSRLNSEDMDRLGAVTVLNNPTNAVCTEFTDLFIALSRAAGIPARELDGYAYSTNLTLRPLCLGKTLHVWPEYWSDNKGWVMVDPTWEQTSGGVDYFSKLDLNHLVLAIKGLSSDQPISTDSAKVNLSEKDFLPKPQLSVIINTTDPILAGFPGKIKVKITNSGNAAFHSASFGVTSSHLNILYNNQNLGYIPSFGTSEFDLNFRTKSLFDSFDDQIIVLIGSQKFTKDLKVTPLLGFHNLPVVVGGVILIMVLLYSAVLLEHIYRMKHPKKKK